MTWMLAGPGGAAVVGSAQAGTLENESVSLRLLLDASAPHAAASEQPQCPKTMMSTAPTRGRAAKATPRRKL